MSSRWHATVLAQQRGDRDTEERRGSAGNAQKRIAHTASRFINVARQQRNYRESVTPAG